MLTTAFVLARIVSNPVSNLFQKILTNHSDDPLFIICVTHALLTAVCLPLGMTFLPLQVADAFWPTIAFVTLLAVAGNMLLVYSLQTMDLSILGPINVARSTYDEKNEQLDRVMAFKKKHAKEAEQAIKRLHEVVLLSGNSFAEMTLTSRHATLRQISAALYAVGGQYRRSMSSTEFVTRSAGTLPALLLFVRPAWASSWRCKSSRKESILIEAKRSCGRVTDRGKEAWSINHGLTDRNRIEGADQQGEGANDPETLMDKARSV